MYNHRLFQECLPMYEVSREGNKQKKIMKEINWGKRVETDGQRQVCPQIIELGLRRWEIRRLEYTTEVGPTFPWSVPRLQFPDITLPQLRFSLMWFHVRDPAPPTLCLFFLTVWWLLSLLCCHGNLGETVGAHYIYSLSSLFENELSVFCLGWHEKHVLTPESWSLYIRDALTLESKKYMTANSVNLESLTGRSSSWTDIYTSMIYISSQFLLLMRNSWD